MFGDAAPEPRADFGSIIAWIFFGEILSVLQITGIILLTVVVFIWAWTVFNSELTATLRPCKINQLC
jgi:hypothetical protein